MYLWQYLQQLCQNKSNYFSHWLLSSTPWTFHTFAADWFPDLHFPLIETMTKGDQKERLPCKAESSKGFSCHMALSISPHLAAQGVTAKHDSSSCPITHARNGFIFSFSTLEVKCGAAGQATLHNYHYQIETTSQLVPLITCFLISTFYIFLWNLSLCFLKNWK